MVVQFEFSITYIQGDNCLSKLELHAVTPHCRITNFLFSSTDVLFLEQNSSVCFSCLLITGTSLTAVKNKLIFTYI